METYPNRIKRWWREYALDKLTPHYKYAKQLIDILINDNALKLLDAGALYFQSRTRDERQCYYFGRIRFGRLKIWKTQYIQDNVPVNLFERSLNSCFSTFDSKESEFTSDLDSEESEFTSVSNNEDAESIRIETDMVFDEPVLTKSDVKRALIKLAAINDVISPEDAKIYAALYTACDKNEFKHLRKFNIRRLLYEIEYVIDKFLKNARPELFDDDSLFDVRPGMFDEYMKEQREYKRGLIENEKKFNEILSMIPAEKKYLN